ncbi:MAG: hypothetical protein EOP59_15140, partial [Sphingomonadales bacterium]
MKEKVMDAVSVATRDGVAVLCVNYPPVNALSVAVRRGLAAGIEAANADPAIRGIVIRASGKTFIAGADIKELAEKRHLESPTLREIQQLLETGKPSVAAIHGTALGGGLETGELQATAKAGFGLVLLALFAAQWVYFAVCEAYWGRSPGKMAVGLRVVTTSGRPIGWRAAALRNLLRAADLLPVAYLAGVVSMALSSRF